MADFTLNVILDDVKNLISDSITNQDLDSSKFESFHKAIIKRYFDAKNIKINYSKQIINLNLPISEGEFTAITFECLDLKSFIQSCLKKDEQSIYFYQNLLSRYDITTAA